jgi:hypothetical protein
METSYSYARNLPSRMESDTDKDGIVDHITEFVNGIQITTMIVGKGHDAPVKTQHWENGQLKSAEDDTNGDGVIDIVYEYDFYEEIASRRHLE